MKTFEDLFLDALRFSTIDLPNSEIEEHKLCTHYNLKFNDWLGRTKGFTFGSIENYQKELTIENWLDFLQNEREAIENKKNEWQSKIDAKSLSNTINIKYKKAQFRNNFDKSKPADVFSHFYKELVENKFLSEKELYEYLNLAFELKSPPQKRFQFKNRPTKSRIEGVFYKYYSVLAGKPYGKQKDYAALLGEYFIGFKTENVRTNFSKSIY